MLRVSVFAGGDSPATVCTPVYTANGGKAATLQTHHIVHNVTLESLQTRLGALHARIVLTASTPTSPIPPCVSPAITELGPKPGQAHVFSVHHVRLEISRKAVPQLTPAAGRVLHARKENFQKSRIRLRARHVLSVNIRISPDRLLVSHVDSVLLQTKLAPNGARRVPGARWVPM